MTKRWLAFTQIFLILAALAGSVYVACTPANSLMRWYNIDDAFYYYKVAQNILAGKGITFDGINLSNGFHPLWMVICLVVFWTSRFGLILPLRLLVIVSGLFNAATALLLFHLLKKYLHLLAAFITTLAWAILPSIYNTSTVHGMESSISVFFIVLLLKTAVEMNARREQHPPNILSIALVGLIGAFTILARLDNIFIVGLVGLFLLFNIQHISRLYFYDVLALFVSVFCVWYYRLGSNGIFVNLSTFFFMLSMSLLVKPAVYYLCGLYRGVNQLGKFSKFIRQAIAVVVNTTLLYASLLLAYRLGISEMVSRSILIYDAALSFLLVFCLRLFNWKCEPSLQQNPFKGILDWIKSSLALVIGNGIGYALPIGVLVGAYMLFNKKVFDTFTPVSGQIKAWWGTLSNTVYGHPLTFLSVLGLSDVSNYGPWSIITSPIKKFADWITASTTDQVSPFNTLVFMTLFVIVMVFLIAIFTSNEQRLLKKGYALYIVPLLLGCLVQIVYYNMIGYQHTRGWYWLAELLVVILVAGLLLDGIFTWLDRWNPLGIAAVILCLALTLGLVADHLNFILQLAPPLVSVQHRDDYIAEVREVETLTEPGAKIGMTGGGLVAYFIQNRTVVNLDGLINSAEYFQAMKNKKARDFLDALPLNYVYGQEYVVTESDPYRDILDGRLVSIGVIKGFENFTLYKYVINQ